MPQKIKTAKLMLQILGWINIGIAIILVFLFIGGSILIGISKQEGSGIASAILGSLGLIIGIIMIAMGIVCLLTANGINNRKNWAKIVGIIIAILSLTNIPIGTVFGIFILIGLFSQEAESWFTS